MSGAKRDRDRGRFAGGELQKLSRSDKLQATEAFRKWARAGCPEADEIKNGRGAEDLRACAAVFAELAESEKGRGIIRAVEDVYMTEPRRKLCRCMITDRVIRFAMVFFVSERTVYYWLATARKMWGKARNSEAVKSLQ